MFEGRRLLIATKHGKEKVIAPIFENELGVRCFVAEEFDTDQLGTFSGEIERKQDPIETARKKCLLAMELMNCDLAIASEGSFGPHPSIFFVPADDEFLLFLDKKNNLEIIAREISTETNFNAEEIKTEYQLKIFSEAANFPSHALIARKSKEDHSEIIKGIADWKTLLSIYDRFVSEAGSFYLETDMRAMNNPTRMKIIEQVTKKLVTKIKSSCPKCKTPGFGITDSRPGLPCELCHFPTGSTLSYIYSCEKCFYSEEQLYPNEKKFEQPTFCDQCNP
jgi:hypothetical protein